MKELGRWIAGAIFVLLAIFGLAIAANAHDGGFEVFGFVMMIFGLFMLFRFITLTIPSGDKEQA